MARVTLVLGGAAGASAVVASVLVPRVRVVPGPDPISVVVPVVLIGCALLLAQRGRRWTATLLGGSAMVWCAVGVASAVPGPLADDLLRLGVLPLALVVVAVVALPGGTPTATRAATVVALGVAVSGGAGATTHIRLLLGVLLIVVAAHRLVVSGFAAIAHSRLAGMAVLLQSAFGVALELLDPSLSGSIVGPDVAADSVAVGMAAAAFGVLRILDPDLLVRGTTRLARTSADRLGVESWLGDLLGAPRLRVTYPMPNGVRVLENGDVFTSAGGVPVASSEGQVVAWFDQDVVIDPALRVGLLRLLAIVGASARLRAAQKERSAELERSRARLAEAALGESVALEQRLSLSVLPYLDAIEGRAALLPDPDRVRARVDDARGQVRSISRGLAPVSGRGLAAALDGLASLAPDLVTVEVSALQTAASERAPDVSEATAMWFAATEAVVNALKHNGGSKVRVRATGTCALEVSDTGPGGADAMGSGLAGIRDRLAAVGGRLDVSSNENGTHVSIAVPGRIRADPYPDIGLVATTPSALGSYGD
jgi:signal transduction histidine kinase